MSYFLRKKIKLLFYFIFLFSFLFMPMSSFSMSLPTVKEGKYIPDFVIKKIKIGMNKTQLLDMLGDPIFLFSKDVNCWCYYYHCIPKNVRYKKIRKCLILYFEGDILSYYTVTR